MFGTYYAPGFGYPVYGAPLAYGYPWGPMSDRSIGHQIRHADRLDRRLERNGYYW